jgi:(R,R)-butanediol dehydrogenase/meso-butanediol dehydrogenase/diacetyl reductase
MTTDSIQVALVTGKNAVTLEEFPAPQPDKGKAVVDIAYCGICGTDLHAFLSGEPYNPSICGHEWVGSVAAMSSSDNSHNIREGDRVAIGVATACGNCPSCQRGDASHCETVFAGATGMHPNSAPHGGFAPSICFALDRLYTVAPSLSDTQAAILEPVTVAVHAVRRTGIRLGESVVVIGGGPIGLLTLQAAKAAGAGHLTLIEPEPLRRQLGESLGANLLIDPRTENSAEVINAALGQAGADVVFECAGIAATIQTSVDLVRRGGKVSLVGVPNGASEIYGAVWLIKEVNLTSSIAYLNEDFEIAQGLVVDGRIQTETLHTKTVGLRGMQEAFVELANKPAQVKILVDPRID